jgi:hypothetical protein
MAGGRQPGPTGSYVDEDVRIPTDPGVYAGWGRAGPIGLEGSGAPWQSVRPTFEERPDGISFRLGSAQYRVRRPGPTLGLAPDEEVLPPAEAKQILEQAAKADASNDVMLVGIGPTVAGVMRSGVPVIVLRVRPRASSGGAPPVVEAPAPPPKRAKPVKDGWIEIDVVDEDGESRAGDRYRLELPDGRVFEGAVSSKGTISFHGIDPGSAKLSFPGLDRATWA